MKHATTLRVALASALLALTGASGAGEKPAMAVKDVVLVHGVATDGSGWRAVYQRLKRDGFRVSVVQQPLTGLADDVAATRRVIAAQPGPVVLVGHSYGGTIITVAGMDPKVRALVYVAALQPDVGESTNQLASKVPGEVPPDAMAVTADGFVSVKPDRFAWAVAADLPARQADFMAHSQMPVAAAAFDATVDQAAWRTKPSFGVVAKNDRALNPELARWMYRRSGASITEVPGSHLVYVSQPDVVARVIERAARAAGSADKVEARKP